MSAATLNLSQPVNRSFAEEILCAYMDDDNESDALREYLDDVVSSEESKDYYKGLMAGMMFAHTSLNDARSIAEVRKMMSIFRAVAARSANHFID